MVLVHYTHLLFSQWTVDSFHFGAIMNNVIMKILILLSLSRDEIY